MSALRTAATDAADEIIAELYGCEFHRLPVRARASYRAEVIRHIQIWLEREIQTAAEVIQAENLSPIEWQAEQERKAAAVALGGRVS